jgi:hypothetical protein
MRVLLNDRDIGGLDARLERRIQGRPGDRVVEALALTASDAIRARGRELMLLLLGTAGLVAFLLCLNVFIIALRAPQAIGYAIPACAAAAALTGAIVAVVYVLMLGAHRRRVEARASAPQLPAGTAVRLDGAGLTVDGRLCAWAALKVDELGVRQRQGSESRVTYVERLVLSDGGRAIPLDALFLSSGRAAPQQAWYRLSPSGAGR